MFIIKNNYYLYIKNIKDLNIDDVKSNRKINIIYRNSKFKNIKEIIKFRNKCKVKKFKFFVANNEKIAKICRADGLYLSAYNKRKSYLNLEKIGSSHNLKEINEKIKQNCTTIIYSRLFKTHYKNKESYLGVNKFNFIKINMKKNIIPLGGINIRNLLKLNLVNCNGFAILSAVKKKPAISSRLF